MSARSPSRIASPMTIWRQYKLKPSQMLLESDNFISKEYSCGDCGPTCNEFDKKGNVYLKMACTMWSALFLIGTSIGAVGAIQSIIIEEILIVKYNFLSQLLRSDLVVAHIYWAVVTLVPVIVCAALIVYYEPNARGLGIPRIFGYLNCIDIEGFVNFKTVIVKNVCIILASSAGLPGGREEPFIHMGAVMSGSLTRLKLAGWRPFAAYGDSRGRRDLITAGTVAAVAVSFGTPIGAVLFCLEEGITFWNSRLTYIMFVCSVVASYTLPMVRTVILEGIHRSTRIQPYMFFSGFEDPDLSYKFTELPVFILFGFIGALVGTLWNISFTILHNRRKRLFSQNHWKFAEAVIFGILFFVFVVTFFHLTHNYCSEKEVKRNRIIASKEMNVYCEGNTFESIGVFFFLDSRYTMHNLLKLPENDAISKEIMAIGMVYHLVFSVLQSGTILPSGILIPHIILGAIWGNLVSASILPYENIDEWTERAKYTFLGALAQACGITRFTLSLGVIMIESSGRAAFAIPVFIIVLTAKGIGGLMTEPIFRSVAYLNGYPLIRSSLLPMTSSFSASEVMSSNLVSLPMKIELSNLLNVLRYERHQFYPVLINKKVVGVVLRKHILTLFQENLFKEPQNENEIQELKILLNYYTPQSFKALKEKIRKGEYVLRENGELNLKHIMITSPYIVHEKMSLRRIYNLFLSLGVGYLMVVDNNGNAVGIITRNDVARFRRFEQFLLLRTEIVPIL